MSSPIQHWLLLILEDAFELAADAIRKNLIVFNVFLEEVLELYLRHLVLDLIVIFMLVPLLDHRSIEKQSGKRDLGEPNSPSSFKVILTLLTEMVAM